jgi:hypothetical protein
MLAPMLIPDTSPRWEDNNARGGPGDPCIMCGKHIAKPKFMVHVGHGGNYALDPAGDLGGFPIGVDCLRKNPTLKPYAIYSASLIL